MTTDTHLRAVRSYFQAAHPVGRHTLCECGRMHASFSVSNSIHVLISIPLILSVSLTAALSENDFPVKRGSVS